MPIIFYGLATLLLLISLRPNKNDAFLDKNSAGVLKGFFILLIVFSHILNNFPYGGFLSYPLGVVRSILGQLVVSIFFFTSGYGILISVKKNGNMYSQSLLTNRFLRVFLYAVFSLIPFFIYSALIHENHRIVDYFLAPFGWVGFGNEHWFLFAILCCYAIVGIIFLVPGRPHLTLRIGAITAGIIFYIAFCLAKGLPSWWYNTIICFPLGLWLGLINDKVKLWLKLKWISIVGMAFSVLGVGGVYYAMARTWNADCWMVVQNIFFCAFFVFLTRIFVLKSVPLAFLGKHSFGIFIMHMMVINLVLKFGPLPNEWFNYGVLFLFAPLIGIPFSYLYQLIDRFIVNPIVTWNRNLIPEEPLA